MRKEKKLGTERVKDNRTKKRENKREIEREIDRLEREERKKERQIEKDRLSERDSCKKRILTIKKSIIEIKSQENRWIKTLTDRQQQKRRETEWHSDRQRKKVVRQILVDRQ